MVRVPVWIVQGRVSSVRGKVGTVNGRVRLWAWALLRGRA